MLSKFHCGNIERAVKPDEYPNGVLVWGFCVPFAYGSMVRSYLILQFVDLVLEEVCKTLNLHICDICSTPVGIRSLMLVVLLCLHI